MVLLVIALGKGVFVGMHVQGNKLAETQTEMGSKHSS